jgi:hypothetical protein
MDSGRSTNNNSNIARCKLSIIFKMFSYFFKNLFLVTMPLQECFAHIGIVMSVKRQNCWYCVEILATCDTTDKCLELINQK